MQLRVFVSFDMEKDEDLFKKLMAESKAPNANFVIFDRSTREVADEGLPERLKERVSRCDLMLVLCGEWTHRALNVSAELAAAQAIQKRYYLLKGRRFRDCARPANARISDKLFKWSPGAVEQLVLRNI